MQADERIRKAFTERNVKAVSLAIHRNGKCVYTKQMGKTDDSGRKINTHTLFTIGSVSKVFTAISVLMLKERGLLELDDPLYKYIDLQMADERYKDITIRQILSHCGGFSGNASKGKYTLAQNEGYLDQVLTFMKEAELNQTPGTFSVYCNDGFAMAEKLVEVLSGESFSDFVRENICDVCGMKDTDFPDHEIADGKIMHADSPFESEYPQEFVNSVGSGGIYSTAEDLCLFLDAINDEKLLQKETHAEMNRRQTPDKLWVESEFGGRYGLGWDDVQIDPATMFGTKGYAKGGSTYGFTSYVILLPELHLSAAVVMSSKDGQAPLLLKQVVADMLAEEGRKVLPLPEHQVSYLHGAEINGLYGNNASCYEIKDEEGKITVDGRDFCFDGKGYAGPEELWQKKKPELLFVRSENTVYMVLEYDTEVMDTRECRIWLQKLAVEEAGRFDGEGKTYLMSDPRYNQRKIDYLPMVLTLKRVENYILAPYPLRIESRRRAVPAIAIPDNYSREVYPLVMNEEGFRLGQYHYVPLDTVEDLRTCTFTISEGKTHYFHGSDRLDTLKMSGEGRCFMLNAEGKAVYDSMYSRSFPEHLEGLIIGIAGRDGTVVEMKAAE